MRRDRVLAVELLVQVLGEDLDVSGFIHRLGCGVELGVDGGHLLRHLGGREECSLLAVEDLAQEVAEQLECVGLVLVVRPGVHRRRGIGVRELACQQDLRVVCPEVVRHLVLVDVRGPVEVGADIPLGPLRLLVERHQLLVPRLVVPGVPRLATLFDQVLGLVRRGDEDRVDVVDVGTAGDLLGGAVGGHLSASWVAMDMSSMKLSE